jgi:hypothetical protein
MRGPRRPSRSPGAGCGRWSRGAGSALSIPGPPKGRCGMCSKSVLRMVERTFFCVLTVEERRTSKGFESFEGCKFPVDTRVNRTAVMSGPQAGGRPCRPAGCYISSRSIAPHKFRYAKDIFVGVWLCRRRRGTNLCSLGFEYQLTASSTVFFVCNAHSERRILKEHKARPLRFDAMSVDLTNHSVRFVLLSSTFHFWTSSQTLCSTWSRCACRYSCHT